MDQSIDVSELTSSNIEQLAPMLAASPSKQLRVLAAELGPSLDLLQLRSIGESLSSGNSRALFATSRGKAAGLILLADNPWETAVIGEKAAVLSQFMVAKDACDRSAVASHMLAAMLEHAASVDVKFLSCKPYSDDVAVIHALERHGFRLMDTIVDCHFDFRRTALEAVPVPLPAAGVTLRAAVEADRSGLRETSRLAFQRHFGRFHADERIGPGKAARFYEQWIDSSIDGYADWIDVAEISGKIAGFSIWKHPSRLESELPVRIGHYSLSGIHPDFQGRGLFTALTFRGMERMRQVADVIEGPTHIKNHGVQAAYSRLHWRVCADARHSFHKWID